MAKRRKPEPTAAAAAPTSTDEVPVVGMREPCPCGSGRRYKACHGRAASHRGQHLVTRPFQGLASEGDWVALREIVPAATAPLTPVPGALSSAGVTDEPPSVTLATVLPMAWPGLVRTDGSVFVGLQVNGGSGDASRDIADALVRAASAEPGNPVPPQGLPGEGPRLQDLLDPTERLQISMHDGFDFWIEGVDDVDGGVRASLERANAGVVPTQRLSGVEAAYWVRIGTKEHLRWVLPYDEEPLLDGLARLRAAEADDLGPGTRLLGTFRAHGLLVPVWDLAPGDSADDIEEPAAQFLARLEEALADTTRLTDAARRARAGLQTRQITLR